MDLRRQIFSALAEKPWTPFIEIVKKIPNCLPDIIKLINAGLVQRVSFDGTPHVMGGTLAYRLTIPADQIEKLLLL